MLQTQLQAALEREVGYREHIAGLTAMLRESQHRYDRLLEAPRSVMTPQGGTPPPQRPAALWPETWQRIQTYMAGHGGVARPREVGPALGLRTCAYIMRRMCDAGILVRLAAGVYQLAE